MFTENAALGVSIVDRKHVRVINMAVGLFECVMMLSHFEVRRVTNDWDGRANDPVFQRSQESEVVANRVSANRSGIIVCVTMHFNAAESHWS